jgi:hypothetical protein
VTATTKGEYTIEYSDGTIHKVYPCSIAITGTTFGERTFAVTDKFTIVDEKNDFITIVEFNPDDRGTFSKLFTSKKTFPDDFK